MQKVHPVAFDHNKAPVHTSKKVLLKGISCRGRRRYNLNLQALFQEQRKKIEDPPIMSSRLLQEMKEIQTDKHGITAGTGDRMRIVFHEDNLYTVNATLVGPPFTPYANGYFNVDILVPSDYPFTPPEIRFATRIWHPNIFLESGHVCINILQQGGWSASWTLHHAMLVVYSLLSDPLLDGNRMSANAPAGEMYEADRHHFVNEAQEWTRLYAGLDASVGWGDETHCVMQTGKKYLSEIKGDEKTQCLPAHRGLVQTADTRKTRLDVTDQHVRRAYYCELCDKGFGEGDVQDALVRSNWIYDDAVELLLWRVLVQDEELRKESLNRAEEENPALQITSSPTNTHSSTQKKSEMSYGDAFVIQNQRNELVKKLSHSLCRDEAKVLQVLEDCYWDKTSVTRILNQDHVDAGLLINQVRAVVFGEIAQPQFSRKPAQIAHGQKLEGTTSMDSVAEVFQTSTEESPVGILPSEGRNQSFRIEEGTPALQITSSPTNTHSSPQKASEMSYGDALVLQNQRNELVKKLSHSFGCDETKLLQVLEDCSWDETIVTRILNQDQQSEVTCSSTGMEEVADGVDEQGIPHQVVTPVIDRAGALLGDTTPIPQTEDDSWLLVGSSENDESSENQTL